MKVKTLRRDLRTKQEMEREAKLAQERAIDEADKLREFIEEHVEDADNGRIAAFESVIEVIDY